MIPASSGALAQAGAPAEHLAASAAGCFVLASRLIPDLDGGFLRAVLMRTRDLVAAGVDATLLTVDPGTPEAHAEHRAELVRRGEIDRPERLRNLFDEAVADPSWLRAAAHPGHRTEGIEFREIRDAAGRVVLELPVIAGNPDWHLSTASVVVHGDDGAIIGILDGFGGLYRAWLDHVTGRADAVIICEARQLGELLVDWDAPARIVHTIHTAHIGAPYTPDAPILPLWQRFFDIAGRYDAVLWQTAAQRDDVSARFGADRNDHVLPLGADPTDAVRPMVDREPMHAIMVNRLAPGKRLDHAVRIWRRVVDALPQAVLDIYGEGASRGEIEALIAELGLTDSVILHGQIPNPAEVLERASLLLLTTAFEGQSLAIVEALSHGTPVVTYDVRYGPAEALANGGGVLVDSGDEEAAAAAVLEIMRDAQLRERMSVEGLAAAQAASRTVMAERLVEILSQVAQAPRRR